MQILNFQYGQVLVSFTHLGVKSRHQTGRVIVHQLDQHRENISGSEKISMLLSISALFLLLPVSTIAPPFFTPAPPFLLLLLSSYSYSCPFPSYSCPSPSAPTSLHLPFYSCPCSPTLASFLLLLPLPYLRLLSSCTVVR